MYWKKSARHYRLLRNCVGVNVDKIVATIFNWLARSFFLHLTSAFILPDVWHLHCSCGVRWRLLRYFCPQYHLDHNTLRTFWLSDGRISRFHCSSTKRHTASYLKKNSCKILRISTFENEIEIHILKQTIKRTMVLRIFAANTWPNRYSTTQLKYS